MQKNETFFFPIIVGAFIFNALISIILHQCEDCSPHPKTVVGSKLTYSLSVAFQECMVTISERN